MTRRTLAIGAMHLYEITETVLSSPLNYLTLRGSRHSFRLAARFVYFVKYGTYRTGHFRALSQCSLPWAGRTRVLETQRGIPLHRRALSFMRYKGVRGEVPSVQPTCNGNFVSRRGTDMLVLVVPSFPLRLSLCLLLCGVHGPCTAACTAARAFYAEWFDHSVQSERLP